MAVQTVFEGFGTNTFEKAREVAARYELTIPVGQSGEDGVRSALMNRYRTGGTPWVVLIDRQGIVRYNDFRIRPDRAAQLIDAALAQPASPAAIPASRRGGELLATAPDLAGLKWLEPESGHFKLQDRVTLVRWFTGDCPFCAASIPAIGRLREEFAKDGLQTLAIYHPKPPGSAAPANAVDIAKQLGYAGALAFDPDWMVLNRLYLRRNADSATSISLIVDRQGKVRYVHPGPVYHPTTDPQAAQIDRDYRDVRRVIQTLLSEK